MYISPLFPLFSFLIFDMILNQSCILGVRIMTTLRIQIHLYILLFKTYIFAIKCNIAYISIVNIYILGLVFFYIYVDCTYQYVFTFVCIYYCRTRRMVLSIYYSIVNHVSDHYM